MAGYDLTQGLLWALDNFLCYCVGNSEARGGESWSRNLWAAPVAEFVSQVEPQELSSDASKNKVNAVKEGGRKERRTGESKSLRSKSKAGKMVKRCLREIQPSRV